MKPENLKNLSPIQEKVLRYASRGYSDRAIAARLKTTSKAVAMAMIRVYRKLDIDDPQHVTNPRVIAACIYRHHHPELDYADKCKTPYPLLKT